MKGCQSHAEAERDDGVRMQVRETALLPHLFYEFIASLLFPLDHFSGLSLHKDSHYLFELLEVRGRVCFVHYCKRVPRAVQST